MASRDACSSLPRPPRPPVRQALIQEIFGVDFEEDRIFRSYRLADAPHYLEKKPRPVLEFASVFVGPLIERRREELAEQIAMGRMDLYRVEACLFRPVGGLSEGGGEVRQILPTRRTAGGPAVFLDYGRPMGSKPLSAAFARQPP